ncbi:MAG: hypothetical protein GX241_01245 [Ruminococcaceae bacterium]|nr:hypothetical protein [Oscillospiraceae bacterium]
MGIKEDLATAKDVHVLRRIFSLFLVLLAIISVAAAGIGLDQDFKVKAFLEETDVEQAKKDLTMLKDGIQELKDNEETYFAGIQEYTAGLAEFTDGQKQVAAGEIELAEGGKQLKAGQAEYDYYVKLLADGKKKIEEGEKLLADGKAELAAGEAELESHRQEYNEGKQMIEDSKEAFELIEKYKDKQWFVGMMSTDVMINILNREMGLDIPKGTKNVPAYLIKMRDDGIAQLKEFEDGERQVAEGKKMIADGEAELAAGKKEYNEGVAALAAGKQELDAGYAEYAAGEKLIADGKKQLAEGEIQLTEGKSQLDMFSDGVRQVRDGLMEVLALETVYTRSGVLKVKSPLYKYPDAKEKLTKLDENGNPVKLHDDTDHIDLDLAAKISIASFEYLEDAGADAESELINRILLHGLLAIAGILTLIAGVIGFFGRGAGLTIFIAIFGFGLLIFGIHGNFFDYAYKLKSGVYVGDFQSIMVIVFALMTLNAAIVYWYTRLEEGKPLKEKLTGLKNKFKKGDKESGGKYNSINV